MEKRLLIAVIMLTLAVFLLSSACVSFKLGPKSSSSAATSSEPLAGSWAMTRVSIEPALPDEVPAMVIDQALPRSPVWKISSAGSQLAITYDGRPVWFNNMGINTNPKTVVASESADKNSCTFSGGGGVQMGSLPAAVSLLSPKAGGIKDISASYTDKVSVTLTSQDQISAVITYTATGSYTSGGVQQSVNYQGQITYTGTRK